MKFYRCKSCGELDSIGEVSVVPRWVAIRPDGEYLSQGWADECAWEAETVLGYACFNEKCERWQGNFGIPALTDEYKRPVFENAWPLSEIAEEVETDG